MEKGIVLEQDGNQVVVLTPDGQFKRIKVEGEMPAIGEEICIKPVAKSPVVLTNIFVNQRRWMAAAAAVFLLLVSPLAFRAMTASSPTVAYLAVDINPSIELELDKNGKVVGNTAINKDGEKVLGEAKLKGLKAADAVDNIVSKAIKEGFIANNKDNMVLITLSRGSEAANLPVDLSSSLKEKVEEELLSTGLEANVHTAETSLTVREEAKKEGVSAGRFAIYLSAKDTGLDIKLEELKDSRFAKVISNAGGSPATLLWKVEDEKDYANKMEKYWVEEKKGPTSRNLVVNGGFEDGSFAGWDKGGVYEQSVSDRAPYDGSYAAVLGKPDYQGTKNDIPVGLNWLSREIQLPEQGNYVTLKFRYRFETYDGMEKDTFAVLLKDEKGQTLETLFRYANRGSHGIKQDLEWKEEKIDLTKYKGLMVKLVFGLSNGDSSANTWVSIDNVQISYQ